jgi:branched-chain amino acid transport system permease protein
MTVLDTLQNGVARTKSRLNEDARSRNGMLFMIAGVLALLAPILVGGYTLDLVMQLIILVLVVTSWIFIAGYFGMFSFAHAALYGIGAYAAVLLAGEAGVHPIVGVLLGGVVAGILSIPIALPVLRLSGAYVGMVTLAFAEIVFRLVIVFRDVTGGPTGYTNFPALFGGSRIALYYFVFVLVGALLLVQYGLLVNRFGLVARAIREAPDAARMLGNNVPRYKLAGFIIGSSIAGVAGGLQAHTVLIISPPMIEVNRMIEFMAMGIIGGFRTISGGVFGAVIVFGLSEGLRDLGEVRLVIWSIMLIVVTIYFPSGIAGSSLDPRERLRELLDRDKWSGWPID